MGNKILSFVFDLHHSPEINFSSKDGVTYTTKAKLPYKNFMVVYSQTLSFI
jgi:hypothetical protein